MFIILRRRPVRRAAPAVVSRYVRKPRIDRASYRPYGRRIEPTGPPGRHRLTVLRRVRRSTYRPVMPTRARRQRVRRRDAAPARSRVRPLAALRATRPGRIRWHGHPDDIRRMPHDVLGGRWSDAIA